MVAALGDSMTAATGANAVNALEVAIDNRGLSFSIGGERTSFLLMNHSIKRKSFSFALFTVFFVEYRPRNFSNTSHHTEHFDGIQSTIDRVSTLRQLTHSK